jgi:hypothetical protein
MRPVLAALDHVAEDEEFRPELNLPDNNAGPLSNNGGQVGKNACAVPIFSIISYS